MPAERALLPQLPGGAHSHARPCSCACSKAPLAQAMWERPAPADYGLHQQRPDRAPLSLDAPKPRSPLGPHNGPAPHSPSHAKAPSGGPLASVRPGRQQALGAAADPPSPEGLAWKADASLPASLRGPDTPPGAISEASLARSSSGGEACSSPDPGLAEEVQGPECGEAPCQHHRQLPGQWVRNPRLVCEGLKKAGICSKMRSRQIGTQYCAGARKLCRCVRVAWRRAAVCWECLPHCGLLMGSSKEAGRLLQLCKGCETWGRACLGQIMHCTCSMC